MMTNEFAVLILTHGRADNVVTVKALMKAGYTGKTYIVIDNEDKQRGEYIRNFGKNNVIVFDKLAISKEFDTADNFNDRRAIVYARNASFKIAKELGLKYFVQLDDDYNAFNYRTNELGRYGKETPIKKIDNIFKIMIKFINDSGADSVAMSQGGDNMGSKKGEQIGNVKRKCMNSFVCRVDKPFDFLGAINEDVNTYTYRASLGMLFFTIMHICLHQKQTQASAGGMTDIYLDGGTYKKSFYTVIFQPSSVKVSLIGGKGKRLHHLINWKNTVPKIINERYKKV